MNNETFEKAFNAKRAIAIGEKQEEEYQKILKIREERPEDMILTFPGCYTVLHVPAEVQGEVLTLVLKEIYKNIDKAKKELEAL